MVCGWVLGEGDCVVILKGEAREVKAVDSVVGGGFFASNAVARDSTDRAFSPLVAVLVVELRVEARAA